MEYFKAKWLTAAEDDPILLYSELDDNRLEVRKVEVYRDGPAGWADGAGGQRCVGLGWVQVPSLEEINAQPEFEAVAIGREEFERVWASARAAS